jgi:hypothetical protein
MQLQVIQKKIHEVRGQKVMLDFDLAELYEVETKALNQAVKRNAKRFPIDFMFRLTSTEWGIIRSQIVTASKETMKLESITASQMKRNVSATPYAFTEQGLAMLSGILNSDKAIDVNISIMRAFVFMRQYALSHKDLTEKLRVLESKYNKQFKDVYEAINYLLQKDKQETEHGQRTRIRFKPKNSE